MSSYMSMYYALTHNGEGKEVAPPQVVSATYAAYINEPFVETERVHMIMARKAWQLYHSIQDKGQQFLDKAGLKALLFAPLETAAAADSVVEVILPPVELAAISDIKEDALVPDMDQDGDAEKKASIVYGEGSTEEFGTK